MLLGGDTGNVSESSTPACMLELVFGVGARCIGGWMCIA